MRRKQFYVDKNYLSLPITLIIALIAPEQCPSSHRRLIVALLRVRKITLRSPKHFLLGFS